VQNDLKDNPDQDALPSKTRRKQEMHALQDIGEKLVELNSKRLAELNLPESLMDAVTEAKRLH
jgi:ribosome-associated protein